MVGTTLHIANNMIVIQIEKSEDMYDDGDKQTVMFLTSNLSGLSMNHTKKIITLFLNIRSIESYTIDFTRGNVDSKVSQANYESALTYFTS